jgi:hypothetical protein
LIERAKKFVTVILKNKIVGKIFKYKIIILAMAIGFLAGFLISVFFHSPYGNILSNELSKYKEGTWLAKIDGERIGDAYLEKRYSLFKEYISNDPLLGEDPLLKDRLLRKLVDNYCILKTAQKSGIFNGRKAADYLWLFIEESMVNYYLDFLSGLKTDKKIKLTEKEIDDFYMKNKALFDKKDIPKNKAVAVIKREINSLNEKYGKEKKYLARRIELGRIKKDKKIVINKDLMKTTILNEDPKQE